MNRTVKALLAIVLLGLLIGVGISVYMTTGSYDADVVGGAIEPAPIEETFDETEESADISLPPPVEAPPVIVAEPDFGEPQASPDFPAIDPQPDIAFDEEPVIEPAPIIVPDESVAEPDFTAPPIGPKETDAYDVQRVFFGTDRAVDGENDVGPIFGAGRANRLSLGMVDITIPKTAHSVGRVERPRAIRVLGHTLWEGAENPEEHFVIYAIHRTDRATFERAAADTVTDAETFAGSAFVFIHGFNTPFDKAMFRTAQIAYDLGFDGPAFAYSWPSKGKTLDYVTDMDSADNAAPHMDAFLDIVFGIEGVERVHLIAHSMGNAALAELLTRAGTKIGARNDVPIDQMVLAAPDLDADNFEGIAERFTRVAHNVTIYAASTDTALEASKKLRSNYFRLGDVGPDGPLVVAGVDSIDVSAVGTEILSLNHNVYARSRGVLNDLGLLFATGQRPPSARIPTVRAVDGPNGTYWQMPK